MDANDELAIARVAARLPALACQAEAERALEATRDELLQRLERAARHSEGRFAASYVPTSLKDLEAWYCVLAETGFIRRLCMRRSAFERRFAMYFGEVLVRNAAFEWVVEEYAFEKGKYEIGLRKGHLSVMLQTFDHLLMPANLTRNKRRESAWRDYLRLAG